MKPDNFITRLFLENTKLYEHTNLNVTRELASYRKSYLAISFCIEACRLLISLLFENSKSKGCQVFVYTKNTSYMIQSTFVYISIVCALCVCTKNHTNAVLVSQFYRICIVCTLFICTKNIHFKFQVILSLSFV